MNPPTVLGVDACPDGWVGVELSGPRVTVHAAATVAELINSLATAPAVIGIDIPIGLATSSTRQADVLARRRLGRRGSSVFATPVRAALEADTYDQANRINRELSGAGISRQAYGLRVKILEVDAWLTHQPLPVIEVHPELSFQALAAADLPGKKTWAGMWARYAALQAVGIDVPVAVGERAGRAQPDDVLDAAAAAWSAARFVAGQAESLPNPPETLDRGSAAIWF